MRSSEFKSLGLHTLQDLTDENVYRTLADKFITLVHSLKFTDSSINENELSERERDLFLRFNNPKSWAIEHGRARQQLREKQRFTALVNHFGNQKLNVQIPILCNIKIDELCAN